MNATTVRFFGGPHDGLAVQFGTVRPVVFLPTNPDQFCLYTECKGTPKAEYRLVNGRYEHAGTREPDTMGKP